MLTTLIVPAFDETKRLDRYLPTLIEWVDAGRGDRELLFVDDGSVDGTADALVELLPARPEVRVLRRPHTGKGGAITAGIENARGEVVAFCDLDLSVPLDDLDRLIDAAGRAPVLAIGSRGLRGSDLVVRQHPIRETLGKAYNRAVQAFLTPGTVDTQCGAKAAQRRVWMQILPHAAQVGFAWDVEVIALARSLGFSVVEIAVTWSHRDGSSVRVVRDGVDMLRAIPRIRATARSARSRPPTPEIFDPTNARELSEHDSEHWWFRSKAAHISRWLPRRADGWLVDVGGGSGGTTSSLGWDPRRLLLMEGNVALAAVASTRHAIQTTVAEVSALPVRERSAAVVTMLDVIEHLDEPVAALREARRILADSGRLIVSVPAHTWLWSDADVTLGHRRRYSRRELRDHLERAGFDVEHLTHVFSWLVPAVWLVRRRASGEAAVGLGHRSALIDLAALVLTRVEIIIVRFIPLPFGTSVLAVARPKRP